MSGLIDLASLDDAALAALSAGGGLTRAAVKTSAYTAAAGDLIPVDTTSGNVTITLPTAPADKARVAVKHIIQGGTNTVTVVCGGSDVLNKTGGNTTATLSLVNQGATYEYQASTHIWTVTGSDLPLSGLDTRYVTPATATATFAPIGQQPTVPNLAWPIDPATATIVTTFASGHGFTTSGADAASNVDDTTTGLPVLGTQCATVVSAGAGASAILQKTGLTAIDTTNANVAVLVKVDDLTNLSSLAVSFGNGGFTNEYHVTFGNQGSVTAGQWTWVTLAISDAATLASPTRTGVTAVRVYHKDDNTGAKVTVHWGAIAFFPNAGTISGAPYPSGVATVSFDDGWASVWTVAKPYMDAKGLRGAIHAITDTIGTSSHLTVAQLKAMQDQAGWEVTGHAYTEANHAADFTHLTSAQLLADSALQKEWLRANGLNGQGTAYPGGYVNQTAVEALRHTWRYARNTVGLTETYPPGDPYRLKAYSAITTYSGGRAPSTISANTTGKIDLAVTEKSWLNLTFHQIVPQILSLTMSGNTATITFAVPHEFSTGTTVTMAGWTPSGLNGSFPITAKTATTISVNIGSAPGDGTVMGSVLASTTQIAYGDFTGIIDKLASSGIAVRTYDEVFSRTATAAATSATLTSTAPVETSTAAATVGAAGTAARADHAHPRRDWQPSDHGYLSWAYDPAVCSSSSILATAGTVYVVKIHLPVATFITNLHVYVSTAGSTLTSGQCFAGVYQAGTLLGSTADQSTAWASTGVKTMAISGGAVAAAAGDVYVAFFANGTTLPTLGRTTSNAVANAGLAAASSRFGTADTGRTTSLPVTLGTVAALSQSYWVAAS